MASNSNQHPTLTGSETLWAMLVRENTTAAQPYQ